VVTASTPTATQTVTRPAGPLQQGVVLNAGTQGGAVAANYIVMTTMHTQGAEFEVIQGAGLTSAPGVATCGPNTVLWDLSAPQPTPALVRVDFLNGTTPGAPQPSTIIDVLDDGLIDFVNGQAVHGQPLLLVTVGPQPLRTRITTFATNSQVGQAQSFLILHFEPWNQVGIQTVALGCGATATVIPTFVDLGVEVLMPEMAIAVFGFLVQPLLLPPAGSQPCLLVPSPDVLLLMPPGGGMVHVGLPAAVRPATFWVQGVTWPATGLQVSDAFRVSAF
jgi:hypothetical protein